MQEDVTEFPGYFFFIDNVVNGDLNMFIRLFLILFKDVGYLAFFIHC